MQTVKALITIQSQPFMGVYKNRLYCNGLTSAKLYSPMEKAQTAKKPWLSDTQDADLPHEQKMLLNFIYFPVVSNRLIWKHKSRPLTDIIHDFVVFSNFCMSVSAKGINLYTLHTFFPTFYVFWFLFMMDKLYTSWQQRGISLFCLGPICVKLTPETVEATCCFPCK